MADNNERDSSGGDSGWAIIPVVALFIPLFAISAALESEILQIAVSLAIVIVMSGMLARSLLAQRHMHRIEELETQASLTRAESEQLAQANRIMDQNAEIRELRNAITEPSPELRDSRTETN